MHCIFAFHRDQFRVLFSSVTSKVDLVLGVQGLALGLKQRKIRERMPRKEKGIWKQGMAYMFSLAVIFLSEGENAFGLEQKIIPWGLTRSKNCYRFYIVIFVMWNPRIEI